MARRVNTVQKEVEETDLGNPGEFYFAEPKVFEIRSPKPENVSSMNRSGSSVTYGEGVCRLQSSHNIHTYSPPQGIEYHLGRWPNKMDVDAYLEMYRVQGFDKGAIVCRKYQPFDSHSMVHRWGVILLVHNYMTATEYKPYCIKWFGDGSVESAWGEDLYLLNAALDERLLYDILESQGCDLPMILQKE